MTAVTPEEENMVFTILSNSTKKENMSVEDYVAEVLPAFQASYENSKQDHKEFWEGFTPAGERPTMYEIVIWTVKKLTMKQEELAAGEDVETGLLARYQVRDEFLDTLH